MQESANENVKQRLTEQIARLRASRLRLEAATCRLRKARRELDWKFVVLGYNGPHEVGEIFLN